MTAPFQEQTTQGGPHYRYSRGLLPISFLVVPAITLLVCGGMAKAEAGRSKPSLIVEPTTGIRFSGPQGGPFSPPTFQYRIRASAETVRYSIRIPSWLMASSTQGTVDTAGVLITLALSA